MTFESVRNDIVRLCPDSAGYTEALPSPDGKACSFRFYGQVGFRMILGKKVLRIEMLREYVDDPALIAPNHTLHGDVLYLNIDNVFDYDAFLRVLPALADSLWEGANSEPFGCCSSFVDCSDAKRCLYHGNSEYAGCHYRKNLNAGRIFYGKNKTI